MGRMERRTGTAVSGSTDWEKERGTSELIACVHLIDFGIERTSKRMKKR